MAPRNPFKPTAGATPPLLVGRQALLEELESGITDGPGAPARLTIFTGARGVGKTVMLSEADDIALRNGWLTIDETATSGMLERIGEHTSHLLSHRKSRQRREVTGLTLPGGLGGISLKPTPEQSVGVRRKITKLLDMLGEHDPNNGLLITIDEVHSAAADLRELAVIVQHLVREDRQIALVMAGLPSSVSALLRQDAQDKILTFLRRADKHLLGDVSVDEVYDAFEQTIVDDGRTIDSDALESAANATYGYPFLIQLIGYHVWRAASGQHISLPSALTGIDAARRRMGSLVHETNLADLSEVDKTFLTAMAMDDGHSRMLDIRHRMGDISSQHANSYRERLIAAQIIKSTGHGRVDFALPLLRSYLQEHSATLGLIPHLEN